MTEHIDLHAPPDSPSSARPVSPMPPRLDEVTRERAVDTLRGLVGDEEAAILWTRACQRAGLEKEDTLDFDELERIAEVLMSHEGPVSLVGSSLSIRVRTYRMLDGAQRLGSFLEIK